MTDSVHSVCVPCRILDGQDGVEDVIPDLARDSESEVEVLVVVGKVVLFHLAHVRGQLGVMQRVVHAVIQDVCGSESAT